MANRERFDALKVFVRDKLKTGGRDIIQGDTAIRPYKQGSKTACDYCPYHPVCGFDKKIEGFGYRRLKPVKAEEIWNEIEGGSHGDEMD